jgi:hypothetical protein
MFALALPISSALFCLLKTDRVRTLLEGKKNCPLDDKKKDLWNN